MEKCNFTFDLYSDLDKLGEGVKIRVFIEYDETLPIEDLSFVKGTAKLLSIDYTRDGHRRYLDSISPGTADHWLNKKKEAFLTDELYLGDYIG